MGATRLQQKCSEVGHSLSHSLCENKNKKVMVNTECNHSVAGSEGESAGGVGRNAFAGGAGVTALLDEGKGGTTVRIGGKRRNIMRNRISFVPPFHAFSRLTGLKIYFPRFNRPQTTADV